MTGAERAELGEVRKEMQAGFSEMRAGFALMNGRVKKLETARAVTEAIECERRVDESRITNEKRWRFGLASGVITTVGIGLLNLLETAR
jgi:hypothetical protein